MDNIVDLTGRNIIVAGASSGIGREIALCLSRLGANVSLIARREDKLKEVMHEMHGGEHRYYSFDLSDVGRIQELFEHLAESGTRFDGLVYSAGVYVVRPLQLTTYSVIQDVMNINFYAFLEMTRLFAKRKFNRGGSIVAISSVVGQRGQKALSAYGASKAAIDNAVRALSAELAPSRIRINAVAPSFIDTDMYQQYVELSGEKSIEMIHEKQVLGIGQPADVAHAVSFLLSDAAGFITGTVLPVDGGYLSQ